MITSLMCYKSPVTSTSIVTHTRSSAAGVIAHSRGTAARVVAHSRSTAAGIAAIPGGWTSERKWEEYCTVSTDCSRLVMRDAHSSLGLMFTT